MHTGAAGYPTPASHFFIYIFTTYLNVRPKDVLPIKGRTFDRSF